MTVYVVIDPLISADISVRAVLTDKELAETYADGWCIVQEIVVDDPEAIKNMEDFCTGEGEYAD